MKDEVQKSLTSSFSLQLFSTIWNLELGIWNLITSSFSTSVIPTFYNLLMRTEKLKILLLVMILIALRIATVSEPSSSRPYSPENALCTKVIDGDTLVVKLGEHEKVVRLLGIDAPEKGEALFDKAKCRLEELALNKYLLLKKDTRNTDKYGRLLRYVYNSDKVFINAQLLREGLATPYVVPPDVKNAPLLLKASQEAQRNARGVWDQKILFK